MILEIRYQVEPLISSYGYDIFGDPPGSGNVGWSLVKSCGPFQIQSFDTVNDIVHMIPNTYWHGSTPSLTNLYMIYIAGESTAIAELTIGNIDIMDWRYDTVLTDFEGISGIEGKTASRGVHQELSINMKHPILGTGELTPVGTSEAATKIRKAISHCPVHLG